MSLVPGALHHTLLIPLLQGGGNVAGPRAAEGGGSGATRLCS